MPLIFGKHLAGNLLIVCVAFTAAAQNSVPLVTIYNQNTPIVYIEKHQDEYVFYRVQDGSCLGRWDGKQVYVARSHVVKGHLTDGQLFDAQQHLLYLVEETTDGALLLKHPLSGPCYIIQAGMPLLPGTRYYWQWHIASPGRPLLYAVLIYFVYFMPAPLC